MARSDIELPPSQLGPITVPSDPDLFPHLGFRFSNLVRLKEWMDGQAAWGRYGAAQCTWYIYRGPESGAMVNKHRCGLRLEWRGIVGGFATFGVLEENRKQDAKDW